MQELEKKLYMIMDAMTRSDLPIVFKGAMITKMILKEKNFTKIERFTQDIDANWIGHAPSMEYLVKSIDKSIKMVNSNWVAIGSREYGNECSAGIKIVDESTNRVVTKMDIDVKPINNYGISYFYGDMRFKGTMVENIIGDKIASISSDKIFRRTKDLIDIYALSQCVSIRTSDIYRVMKLNGRVLGSFEKFIKEKEQLEHAYDKLKFVEGKPDFEIVYNYTKKFFEPFIKREKINTVWNSKKEIWANPKQHDNVMYKINSELER